MATVVTDLAESLFASRDTGGADVTIDNIRIGSTTSYDAVSTATALRDPNPEVFRGDAISLTSNQGNVVTSVPIDLEGALTGREVGYFSGNNLIILTSTAGQNVFVKAANTSAILSLVYEYFGTGSPTNLNTQVQINVPLKATRDVALAGTDNNAYMTSLRTKESIDENVPDASVTDKGKIALLPTTTAGSTGDENTRAMTLDGAKAFIGHYIQDGTGDLTQAILNGMPDGGVYLKRSDTAVTF